jgi:chaperonin GroES
MQDNSRQDEMFGLDTEDESSEKEPTIRELIESKNIAADLDDEELTEIGAQASRGFEYDLRSRAEWEKNIDEWTKLALQVKEEKTFPWVGASNVKYPLLSTAAMQFNARSYPSLVPTTGNLVKVEVIGKDPTGEKLAQAHRVGTFMSYQLLHEMDNWEEDMDKLLIMLPVVGTLFKKTYFNKLKGHNVSELCLPKDIVVNYWASDLDSAERVSQVLYLNKRNIKERQLSGIYREVDLGDPPVIENISSNGVVEQDETMPYEIIEQHSFYDLDDDGYSEPYIITFERRSQKVLRIVARYDEKTITTNEDGDVARIDPIQYFTKYSFIPNPDGGFYDIGFGLLLSPLNESVNTLINQLIDAGSLNNLNGGFLGKGIKIKLGESRWQLGEWKTVNSTIDDLRKQIMPLPKGEPSEVLFKLMGTLVTSGKELASVAEIFVGKMPGQNTPATTTMATIEQGMKVFTAVYKRIFRSLRSEYKKLFELNSIYMDQNKYQQVMDIPLNAEDFNLNSYNVCPSADPSTPTQTERLMKAQGLMELLPLGTLDPLEVTKRVLEAQEQPNVEQLFSQSIKQTGQFQPPPNPKLQEMEMKGQQEEKKLALKQQEMQFKSELAARDQIFQQQMEAMKAQQDMQYKDMQARLDAAIAIHKQRIFSATEQASMNQQITQKAVSHAQDMRHKEEQNKSKLQQAKNSSASGKSTQSRK